jgi:hypothetical protein
MVWTATPTGPKGQKRLADVIGNAIRIAKIATGEEEVVLPYEGKAPAAKATVNWQAACLVLQLRIQLAEIGRGIGNALPKSLF